MSILNNSKHNNDETSNLQLMIKRDRRSINKHIETNRFEIQKTNFFITFLILTVTFSWFDSMAVWLRILVLVLVGLILLLACYNFFWRTVNGWDINWCAGLWKEDQVTSLKKVRAHENQLKNDYQKLSLMRARTNICISVILFLILMILFMAKSQLKIVDVQSMQQKDVHTPAPLPALPQDQSASSTSSNPMPQATQTNGLNQANTTQK